MNDQKQITWGFLLGTVFFASFVVLALQCDDIDELTAQQDQYCEMVSIWKADATRGIAPEQRNGWPPYQGDEFCQK